MSLSLHYHKTVCHVLVHKMIVSLIIHDTTVCASSHFWLHYKPDMISHFFPLFLSSFLIILKNNLEALQKRDHKLKEKCFVMESHN